MRDTILQIASTGMSLVIGIGFLFLCFKFLRELSTRRWKGFSARFGAEKLSTPQSRHVAPLIVLSDCPSRELFASGYQKIPPVVIGKHPQGISFRVRAPFNLGCPPFVLPYPGLRIEPTSWPDLAGSNYALSHDAYPGAWIILLSEAAEWIAAKAGIVILPVRD